jgi:uncharacterized protein (DUF2267 family)
MSTLAAMGFNPDPHADADYRTFLEALARQGLPQRLQAARATEAVACALAQRLRDPHFQALIELMPRPFKGRLMACERHSGPLRELAQLADFYAAVGEDLGAPPDEVEPTVRAVLAALRAQLSDEAAEEIGARLPEELAPLWSLAS